ncbi:MAG: caspase family protein [Bacteroidota bacterium]
MKTFTYKAYLIGINQYDKRGGISSLRTPVRDVEAIAHVLADTYPYDVELYTQPFSLAEFRELLETISQENSKENECVLFYFAGHGLGKEDKDGNLSGYLIPCDANLNDGTSFLPMHEVESAFEKRNPHHLLIVLDCCFAGNFRQYAKNRSTYSSSHMFYESYLRYKQHKVWYALTSAAHNEAALDIIQGKLAREAKLTYQHSPFAYHFIEALKGTADLQERGIVTITEVYLHIITQLNSESSEELQTPGLWPLKNHQKGEFIFEYKDHRLQNAPKLSTQLNPYKGLRAYEEADAPTYFGRQEACQKLLNKIQLDRFTILTGRSGNGKSSFVKAKLIPEINQLYPEHWIILPVMRPGEEPDKMMLEMLEIYLPEEADPFSTLIDLLENNPSKKVLWVIDQFEELISLCSFAPLRDAFLQQLDDLLKREFTNLRILITLRIDFEPHFVEGELQSHWLPQHRHELPNLSLDELKDIIHKPAQSVGVFFDPPSLPDKIAGQVFGVTGALPLLSFTMEELFLKCIEIKPEERSISEIEYEKLKGVVGIIKMKAENIYEAFAPSHQHVLKMIMLRMVSIEGGEITKRAIHQSELQFEDETFNEQAQGVIQTMIQNRLWVSDKERIEPAHDELVRSWPRLRVWIDELGTDNLRLFHQVRYASRLWEQKEGVLWNRNPQLDKALQLLGKDRSPKTLLTQFKRMLGWK